jgi:endonuclease/exonuclease/phosphatase family metal-dependent hydrolase
VQALGKAVAAEQNDRVVPATGSDHLPVAAAIRW